MSKLCILLYFKIYSALRLTEALMIIMQHCAMLRQFDWFSLDHYLLIIKNCYVLCQSFTAANKLQFVFKLY